jgi:hypothetical protein
VSDTQTQAAIDAMYAACVDAIERGDGLMTVREQFDYRLGTSGHAYSIEGYADILRERDEARAEAAEARKAGSDEIARLTTQMHQIAREHCHLQREVERLRKALPDAIYHGLHTRGIEDGEATRLTEGILRDLGIADTETGD